MSSPDDLDLQIAAAKKAQELILEERKALHSVYQWNAPERVFEIKGRSWFIYTGLLGMAIIVYAALSQNIPLIITVILLVLILFSLNSIPPAIIKNEITNKGLYVFGELYEWKTIRSFWVSQRGNHKLINIEVTKNQNNDRLILLEGEGDIKKIVREIVQHVDYLSESESGINLINRWVEGSYLSLMEFFDLDDTIITKDPNDAIVQLKKDEQVTITPKA